MSWKPGESGNPGGRPKGYGDIRDLARNHTDRAIQVLATIMDDEKAPKNARAAAAQALLDRGWGRPETNLNVNETRDSWSDFLKKIHAPATAIGAAGDKAENRQ
jgi:hypothetical protein